VALSAAGIIPAFLDLSSAPPRLELQARAEDARRAVNREIFDPPDGRSDVSLPRLAADLRMRSRVPRSACDFTPLVITARGAKLPATRCPRAASDLPRVRSPV